ncbi:hypothetical protein BYT27DRAFT_6452815 [Phlegmacium glaucopus]|nr:hypothetical protein BYT27DRAFT_6452815 [Phlegmacium glaucopus]
MTRADQGFKVRRLHNNILTRFWGRSKKQTTYIVIRRAHHIYHGLARRDYRRGMRVCVWCGWCHCTTSSSRNRFVWDRVYHFGSSHSSCLVNHNSFNFGCGCGSNGPIFCLFFYFSSCSFL